jgi:hypothetical protein
LRRSLKAAAGKKKSDFPVTTKGSELGMVVHSCNPSYPEGGGRISNLRQLARTKLVRTCLKTKTQTKALEV